MKLYSTQEAAAYLGVKVETVKYHIYKSKLLSGDVIGKSLVFTQKELDRFKSMKHKAGRKRRGGD